MTENTFYDPPDICSQVWFLLLESAQSIAIIILMKSMSLLFDSAVK